MRGLSPDGWLFLGYLVVLAWGGVRGARRLAAGRPELPPRALWFSTLLGLTITGSLAFTVGRTFGFQPFAGPLGAREVGAGVLALAVSLAVSAAFRAALYTDEDLRAAPVNRWLPRRAPGAPLDAVALDWALVAACVVAASVVEEVAYRGVGPALIEWGLGGPTPATNLAAALVCATLFALAHAPQGWRAVLTIVVHALLWHGLVLALDRTLVVAMVVHGLYNVVVIVVVARRRARLELTAPEAP